MRQFLFKFYTKTEKQEFLTGSKIVTAPNYDKAKAIIDYSPNTPFHHYATVETIKPCKTQLKTL